MKSRGYRLTVMEEEDGSWTIQAPDLPGMVAAGATLNEAARYLPDAIDSWIEGARSAGIPVPEPSRGEDEYSGRFVLRMAKSLHRRLAEAAHAEGVSLNSYCTTLLASVMRGGSSVPTSDATALSHAMRGAFVAKFRPVQATWIEGGMWERVGFYQVGSHDLRVHRLPEEKAEERVDFALSS